MGKSLLAFFASFCFLAFPIPSARAQEIEIKKIKIGMTKEEVKSAYPNGFGDFTIGGVHGKYSHQPLHIEYIDNKVAYVLFFFKAEDFEDILSAVKSKYPQLTCEKSEVQNRMGASFAQYECRYKELSLRRFVDDIETSVLSFSSQAFIDKYKNERDEKNSDM